MTDKYEGEGQARSKEDNEDSRKAEPVLDLERQVAPWDATVGSSPDGGGHEVPGEGGEPVGEHFVGCFKWDEREQ